ncbi:MAG: hypothetical protein Ta2A_14160 [Treponemataceae bacterium]|nr:MAG: hypothetical protein Ta2A_14160 [Treponemataceae bacterium]
MAFFVNPIFSDNMVLQRDKAVRIWGCADKTDSAHELHLSFDSPSRNSFTLKTTIRADGSWSFTLPPHTAGTSGVLSISDGCNTIRFQNVIFGDVWFAGGQSNMELELQNSQGGKTELQNCANSNIRFYLSVKRVVVDADFIAEEKASSWQCAASDTAAALSAVAYYFARTIERDTHVPIGIINCSWGGTSISAWMSEAQLRKSAAGLRYITDYTALEGGKTDAEYQEAMRLYMDELAAYNARAESAKQKNPAITPTELNAQCGAYPWPQPAGKNSPFKPCNQYNARITRIAPYTIKGFLYYQGEEDETRAGDYADMMYYLIDQWRSDWHDDLLPFLFVQLPMWAGADEYANNTMTDDWCVLRECQHKVSRTIANTALACIIDCGEFDNIHPTDKETVGYRLALLALEKLYANESAQPRPAQHFQPAAHGRAAIPSDRVCSANSWQHGCCDAPYPDSFTIIEEDGSVRVNYATPLCSRTKDGEPCDLTGFELSGDGTVFYPAVSVMSAEGVLLRSPKVASPCAVRYAWRKWGDCPLYSKSGLPAFPFRVRL